MPANLHGIRRLSALAGEWQPAYLLVGETLVRRDRLFLQIGDLLRLAGSWSSVPRWSRRF